MAKPETAKRISWWQIAGPIAVLVFLFGVVLPRFIDYAVVWEAIKSLELSAILLLAAMGLFASLLEASVYTSLIPALRLVPGWKAWLGGNSVAGFAPAPWDIVVRYAMYRGFGVEGSVAASSVVVGGGFQVGFSIVMPLLVLVILVLTGHGEQTARVVAAVGVVVAAAALTIVALILRREQLARSVGRLLQRIGDWLLPKFRREPPPNIETHTVEFRNLLLTTLASRWWLSLSFLVAMHLIRYTGMLYLFRQVGIGAETVSAMELLGAYTFGIFVALMPIVPAGLGLVELSYIWLLAGDDAALADLVAAATFTHRIFFWLLPIVVGLVPLIRWIRRGGTMAGLPDDLISEDLPGF